MTRPINRAGALLAMALCLLAAPAMAQSRDQWGLTDRDWLTLGGPQLRAAVGFPAAFPRVLAAAQGGDAKAAALLAGAYAAGAGTPVDQAEGFRWAKVASDSGLPLGHYVLALKYRDGTGTAPDLRLQGQLLAKAVDAGVRPAKVQLAVIAASLETRDLVLTPYKRRTLLQEAANEGDADAPKFLAILDANIQLAEDLEGLPVWKDGRGLIGNHVEFALAAHPCMTIIKAENGPVWSVVWGATTVRRTDASALLFEGPVARDNLGLYPVGATNVPGAGELGFFLNLNNNAFSPDQTRSMFDRLEKEALRLDALCAPYAPKV
jgi:TPR repeat protein